MGLASLRAWQAVFSKKGVVISMKPYHHQEIEPKWQEIWEQQQAFVASNQSEKPKFYALVEFPYPSGDGLHVGHPRPYTAMDIVSRKKRMQGYNVLFPLGWDAFGLPTENFAIKHHLHPELVTARNVERFKQQIRSLGLSFDWTREVNTTHPAYYKWTQWIFLQLFRQGLAYKSEMPVNWCTSCQCVLANEEVVNGGCERCGSEVVRKVKSQWMLKITAYAERLLEDLDLPDLNYIDRVITSQKNWIGRSVGAEVTFGTTAGDPLGIFTTRPDTLFGVTYMVISPEHPYLAEWADHIQNREEIQAYQQQAAKKSDFERTELAKDKSGVQIQGVAAIHPVTQTEIPIFISDYVLMGYGTGAIMAVPAHDSRDYEFAKRFDLPMIPVVSGGNIEVEAFVACDSGEMIHSEFLDGMSVPEAKEKMLDWLVANGKGQKKTNFKLRDWVFSRQRYWGEPIPIVHCDRCGYQPLPESELPLLLPAVETYAPTQDGSSPLAVIDSFVQTTCPKCGGPARRETDTMPQWAGSSWYFLRYCDPENTEALASKEALDYWMPVDWYNGGMEHTTLHLLYSRFWHKFLYDIGVVSCPEPYLRRTSHGMVMGDNGEKMSKSRGNVVNPDEIVADYGADTLRLYEMFMGDFEKSAPWSTSSLRGCRRFLDRVWGLQELLVSGENYRPDLDAAFHRTIKKVSHDIEQLKYNTAIAALMTLLNEITAIGSINRAEFRTFLLLLYPFAPHIAEELHEIAGFTGFVYQQAWPTYAEAKCKDSTVEIVVQLCGKIKAKLQIATDATAESAIALAKQQEQIAPLLDGKTIRKEIYVPGKLVNFVVS